MSDGRDSKFGGSGEDELFPVQQAVMVQEEEALGHDPSSAVHR